MHDHIVERLILLQGKLVLRHNLGRCSCPSSLHHRLAHQELCDELTGTANRSDERSSRLETCLGLFTQSFKTSSLFPNI
jgi:hypothetical protein